MGGRIAHTTHAAHGSRIASQRVWCQTEAAADQQARTKEETTEREGRENYYYTQDHPAKGESIHSAIMNQNMCITHKYIHIHL